MAASNSETSPLLPTSSTPKSTVSSNKQSRSVTFNPTVSTASPPRRQSPFHNSQSGGSLRQDGSANNSTISSFNSKLRRRNSSGTPLIFPPQISGSKIGPQRTSRTAQKLKLLPNPEQEEDGIDEESGRDVYSQFTRIKDPTARRDAARLGKDDRDKLPRVTAFCTASSYRLDDLMRYLKGKAKVRGAVPKLFDECLYSPYSYAKDGFEDGSGKKRRRRRSSQEANSRDDQIGDFESPDATEVRSQPQRRFSDSALEVDENQERRREDLMDLQHEQDRNSAIQHNVHASDTTNSVTTEGTSRVLDGAIEQQSLSAAASSEDPPAPSANFDTNVHIPEIFAFEYGVVVIWGMTVKEEQRFLKEVAKFESEKLSKDDIEVEEFNFYYTREYQARIYNDFISLREKRNYMTKLAISHALAQSTKTSLYEALLDATISTTQNIPSTIARTGRINLSRREINMQIGELFILRINIHLQGSVLDAPELMWAEPQLEPVYVAVRSYLEMDQRVGLLTERLDVVGDLLQVLKEQLTHTHGEYLEWIVIVLIAAEILVAAINIVVDLYAGVD
ncbi:DUF155-domain-containing protein [Polychaeton citri CBS 116435]|uniref:DUF155-domain-containing protein n=1 Tax=Polychaeton citri CBS 116435 TaxID=1314669 RepID=A0A9P4UL16_9PEZI|nr:DUF155-domain-containing protein [Polychaeton citri CBS 116435]